MAFLLPELFAEIAFLTAEVAESAGLSSGAAGLVGGAVAGQASGFVNQQATNLATGLVGEKNVKNIQDTFSDLYAQAGGVVANDPMVFLKLQKERKEKERLALIAEQQPVQPAPISPVPQVPSHSPSDIAKFIVGFSSNLSMQVFDSNNLQPEKALLETVGNDPKMKSLADTLGSFLTGKIPTNDAYKQIAAVYNGLGMEISKNVKMYFDPNKQLIYFELFDELGNMTILYETTSLIVPPIHGVFMGPNSPNNAMPIDLVDMYSTFHDQSYINGPNTVGDYKYISRLSQNYYRMDEEERKYAKIGIVYFATLGSLVSKLFGPSVTTEANVLQPPEQHSIPLTSTNQTIYHIINPEIHGDPGLINQSADLFKQEFYKEVENLHVNDSIMSGPASSGFATKILSQEFGNIMIELL